MEAKEHLTVDDCLELYEKEGIMGLVEKVKEISFKAGIKTVMEWGEELCDNPSHSLRVNKKRKDCSECWQAQLKAWGIK